jgi:hypothetical protein
MVGAVPNWWSQRGVLNPNALPDDYALANQGQLKNIATAAVAQFDERLPGGAGDTLHSLVNGWNQPNAQRNDFAPVNLGQLKNLAKPFYDRLIAVGYAESYPWASIPNLPDDFAVANIGEAKNLFSFDLLATDIVHDSDQNGLSDWWENYYFGHTGVDPSGDADGDGRSNFEEFLHSTDPNDYYDGIVPQLMIVSGDRQQSSPHSFLQFPLIVRVTDGAARPLRNAPIVFTVTSGNGQLTSNPLAIVDPVFSTRTAEDGTASAYFLQPDTNGFTSRIRASASRAEVSFVATTVSALTVAPSAITSVVNAGETLENTLTVTNNSSVSRLFNVQSEGNGVQSISYTDSEHSGGPEFIWTDISSTGTHLDYVSEADDDFEAFDISFAFPYFGNSYSTVYVSSNGFITFGEGSSEYRNEPLPSASMPANEIAVFHDDLNLGASGDVYYQDEGDRVIIQFTNAARYAGDGFVSFQIVLNRDGTILLYYKDTAGTLDRATVGLQNATRDRGITIVYAQPYLKDNLAIRIEIDPSWFGVSPSSGVLDPWGSTNLSVRLMADAFPNGTYAGVVHIEDQQDQQSNVTIPIEMTVNEAPRVTLLSPVESAVWVAGDSIPIAAMAEDADGIIKVEFYADGTKLGDAVGAPYSFVWNNAQVGPHVVKAQATDSLGAAGTSKRMSVDVQIDSDGNGLGDTWEGNYFHNLGQTANGDFDGDRLTNLEEMHLGADPTWADTDGDGISDGDEVHVYHTDPRVKEIRPHTPADPSLELLADGSRTLHWSLEGNAGNSFIIERTTGANGLWTEIGRTGVDATSFVDGSSQTDASYLLYRIRSIDLGGRVSLPTGEMALPPPVAPDNLSLTRNTDGTVTLSWTDRSINETGFVIETQNPGGHWIQMAAVAANVTSYTASAANPNATYRVRARGTAVGSNPSNQIPQLAARYAVIDLGTDERPSRVATNGMVLMDTSSNNQVAGYRWSQGILQPLNGFLSWVRDMNNSGTVVGSVQAPETAGLIWPSGSSSARFFPSPFSYGGGIAYLLTINDTGHMYGGVLDNTEVTDGYSATAAGWGRKIGTLAVVNPTILKTTGYSLEPYRVNNRGEFLGYRIDYNSRDTPVSTINRSPVDFGGVDINEQGIVVGNKSVDGLSQGFSMIWWDGTEHVLGEAGELFGISSEESPQIVGLLHGQQMLWERKDETLEYESSDLNELIPRDIGWDLELPVDGHYHQNVIAISDNGLIAGRGFYQPVDPNGFGIGPRTKKAFLLVPAALVTDYNRDGKIDDEDREVVAPDNPYRFWMNDDNDDGNTGGDDIPTGGGGNGIDTQVNGTRDLVDFFPVFLDIKRLLEILPSDKFDYSLACEDPFLNYVATDLKPETVRDYLIKLDSITGELDAAGVLSNQPVARIVREGHKLDTDFLDKIQDQGKGIILVEAWSRVTHPLRLQVMRRDTGELVTQVGLPLSIDGVEKMYRHVNFLYVDDAEGGRLTQTWEPLNYPDYLCNDKTFVFVHGFYVSPDEARGWNMEMFKRMYWTGSKAKFVGVTWHADETNGTTIPDYHKNVDNAFATAEHLAAVLRNLGPNVTVAAHSLGNIVVGSAIQDWGATPANYFMIDSAVAQESYNGAASASAAMTHPDWDSYESLPDGTYMMGNRVFTSEWHRNSTFAPDDARKKLTWRDRLSSVAANTFNFYSSSEDVLREHDGDPGNLNDTLWAQITESGIYTWCLQEKLKGKQIDRNIGVVHAKIGSTYGGWRFSENIGDPPRTPSPSEAAQLDDASLKTNPVFDPGFKLIIYSPGPEHPNGEIVKDVHSGAPAWITDLTDPNKGSATAQVHANQLLAEMFPARTLPAGANRLTNFEDRNFDMSVLYRNGWPSERQNDIDWKHSDFKVVAYTYVYRLYGKFKTIASLDNE